MTDPFHPSYLRDEQYSVMAFCARLWARRFVIACWGTFVASVVALYMIVFASPYKAESLVRIDSDVLGRGKEINIDAEVDFIRSRSIFLLALNSLGPDVDVIERGQQPAEEVVAKIGGGANVFTSSQPGLVVDKLQVPDRLLNQKLTLRIEKNKHYTLFDPENNLLYSDMMDTEKPGAAKRSRASPPPVQSQPVQLYISELKASPGQVFTLIPRSPKNYLAKLQEQLNIETIGRRGVSGFIRLTFASDDQVFAKRFLNAVVDTYVKRTYDISAQGKVQALERVETQLKETKELLEKAEMAMRDFQIASNTIDMTAETQLALQQVIEVENQIRTIHAKQKELSVYYTAVHPSQVSMKDQLQYLESERARKQRLIDRLPETQQQLLAHKRDVETYKQVYDLTNEKLVQMRNEVVSITGYAKVVDAAEILPGSGMGKFIKNTVLGFMLGALLGSVFVYATLFSPLANLRMVDQVRTISDLPLLGQLTRASPVASFWRTGRLRRSLPLLSGMQDAGRFPEMIALMKNLGFATFGAANPVMMITSPQVNYASAVVAANIATLYANQSKTLLIDCSMGERGLHTLFRVGTEPGLSDVIIGDALLDRAVHTLGRNLYFLPGGTVTSYGAPLLQQKIFLDMVAQLARSFRYVVLYCPAPKEEQVHSPLVEYVGSIALVVSAGTKLERARRFIASFAQHPNVKGLILDDIKGLRV